MHIFHSDDFHPMVWNIYELGKCMGIMLPVFAKLPIFPAVSSSL